MPCIFPDKMIFLVLVIITIITITIIITIITIITIWPYAHPLLYTPPSMWYYSFVELTDWVDLACYSLDGNVSQFYMSLLERAQAIHLVSIDKEPFFDMWYQEMSYIKIFNLGLPKLIWQVRS